MIQIVSPKTTRTAQRWPVILLVMMTVCAEVRAQNWIDIKPADSSEIRQIRTRVEAVLDDPEFRFFRHLEAGNRSGSLPGSGFNPNLPEDALGNAFGDFGDGPDGSLAPDFWNSLRENPGNLDSRQIGGPRWLADAFKQIAKEGWKNSGGNGGKAGAQGNRAWWGDLVKHVERQDWQNADLNQGSAWMRKLAEQLKDQNWENGDRNKKWPWWNRAAADGQPDFEAWNRWIAEQTKNGRWELPEKNPLGKQADARWNWKFWEDGDDKAFQPKANFDLPQETGNGWNLSELFENPLQSDNSESGFSQVLKFLAWSVLVIAIMVALVLVAKSLTHQGPSRKLVNAVDGTELLDSGIAPGQTPGDIYIGQARLHAQKGEFREAVATIILGAMSNIERAGILTFRQGLTLRDYLRSVRQRKQLFKAFRGMIQVYEPLGFGKREATREHYELTLAGYQAGFDGVETTSPA